MGRGAVDAAEDRPNAVRVDQLRDLGRPGRPRTIRPARNQAERLAAISALPVRFLDRKLRGAPQVAVGMARIAGAEVSEKDLGWIRGLRVFAARAGVLQRPVAAVEKGPRGSGVFFGRTSLRSRRTLRRKRLPTPWRVRLDAQLRPREVLPSAALVLGQEHLAGVVVGRAEGNIASDARPRLGAIGQHVADLRAVQPGRLDGPDEQAHAVVAMGGIGFHLGIVGEQLARGRPHGVELGVFPVGIPGVTTDHAFGVGAGDLDEVRRHAAIAGEEGLLHAFGPHLVQQPGAVFRVAPVDDGLHVGPLDALQLHGEIVASDHVGHFHGDRMAEAPARVAQFPHAEAAVAVARADDPDTLQMEPVINVVHQEVDHLPVVANAAEDPGDVGFDEGRVGVAAVHHGNFGLQGDTDGDVAVGAVDRAEDRPHLVRVGVFDDDVPRGAPELAVVVLDQLEGNLPLEIPAAGIGLGDGEAAALEHLPAQVLLMAPPAGGDRDGGLDGPDEADLDGLHVVGLRDCPARAGVLHLQEEVAFERLDQSAERFHFPRGVGVVLVGLEFQGRGLIGAERVDFLEDLEGLGIDIARGILPHGGCVSVFLRRGSRLASVGRQPLGVLLQPGVVSVANGPAEPFAGADPRVVAVHVDRDGKVVRHGLFHIDRLEEFPGAVDLGLAAERLGIAGVAHVGVGGEIGDHAEPLVHGEIALVGAAGLDVVGEVAGKARLEGVKPAPGSAVVAAGAEVRRYPEDVAHRACAGDDHVDDAIVTIQIDFHLPVGVQVGLPGVLLAQVLGDVELQAAAPPDGQVDLVRRRLVRGPVVPYLFHRGVLLGVDRPLAGLGVVAARAGGGRGPDVVVLQGEAVDHVVHQPAIELMEVVESPAAKAGQTAAEEPQPDVAGLLVHLDRGDDAPGQAVLLFPRADLPGPLVEAGEAVLGADPHPRAIHLDRKDVIVGESVGHGEVLPLGVDVRKLVGRCGHRRRGGRRPGRLGPGRSRRSPGGPSVLCQSRRGDEHNHQHDEGFQARTHGHTPLT